MYGFVLLPLRQKDKERDRERRHITDNDIDREETKDKSNNPKSPSRVVVKKFNPNRNRFLSKICFFDFLDLLDA